MKELKIITINDGKSAEILRRKIIDFDLSSVPAKEIKDTILAMRKLMAQEEGVGLSANQAGLEWRAFIASHKSKFYCVFNPTITKYSKELDTLEEGCLSVPEVYADVTRPKHITLEGFDWNGKKIKYKASDILARIFQHETDHLNGILFIDHVGKKPE